MTANRRILERLLAALDRFEAGMQFRELDTVVLDRDLPDHGLRRGEMGAVVEVFEPDGLDVEFVTASGKTRRS